MRKTAKRIGLLLLVIATILSMSITVFAFDLSMNVGETRTLLFSDTPYVSSDTSVIAIQSNGGSSYSAVAVGPGTATVTGGTWMGRPTHTYVITVKGSASNQPTTGTGTATEPEVTVPATAPGTTVPETSAPDNAATKPQTDTVTDQIHAIQQMQQNMIDDMDDGPGNFGGIKIFVFCIFGLVIILFILAIIYSIKARRFSKLTMGPKALPPLRTGPRTVAVPAAMRNSCPNCGQPFGNGAFCATCGTPKVTKNIHHFQIDGKMYAPEFENMVNEWLAENPYIYNCKLHVTSDWTSFAFDLTRKFFITKASIEFNVADRPLAYRHGVAFLYKKRNFRSGSGETLVDQWLENNPDCKAISWENRKISHWSDNALTYTLHYNIVLFQKPINAN